MKKILSLVLAGIMMLSCISVFAEDISSGVFGTEYLEGAKELEFTWNITESSYWELYAYNHSEESLKITINIGTRDIHKLEVAPKQTAAIFSEEKFDKGTYTIQVVSLGTENLCGKLSYQITNNEDNLQRKIPETLTDMSGLSGMTGASKNEVATIFRPIEIVDGNPVIRVGDSANKDVMHDNIFILEPSPETKAVDELFDYGIMKGDPDGNPRFEDTVTRAEATVLLVRMINYSDVLKDYSHTPAFDDIENHWAATEITFARNNNLVEGTSQTTFDPDSKVTVQDFAKMLVTFMGYAESAKQQGAYPHGYMLTAHRLGLFDNLYAEGPDEISRGKVAVMLVNSLDVPLMKQTGFGAEVEYTVMDGKNGVALETFRTALES